MEEPISIRRGGTFTLGEVRQILPVIRRITQDISVRVDALIVQIESSSSAEKSAIAALENQINLLILRWNQKIKKLGAIPKGLWLVDFDFGHGYYCWKYPEADILHWHTRDDGFSGRRPLEELKIETTKEITNKYSNRAGPA